MACPTTPELAAQTVDTYDRIAAQFLADRRQDLGEVAWLDRLLAPLPTHPALLDLGCGGGAPIGAYLMQCGAKYLGVDASAQMLARAKAAHPKGDWQMGDMRWLDLRRQFHGIVAWHSFFHLTAEEQRSALPRILSHLAQGGEFLVTVGPQQGEAVGHVGGAPVYHASLSLDEYTEILAQSGCKITLFVRHDPTCGGSTVLLARKSD